MDNKENQTEEDLMRELYAKNQIEMFVFKTELLRDVRIINNKFLEELKETQKSSNDELLKEFKVIMKELIDKALDDLKNSMTLEIDKIDKIRHERDNYIKNLEDLILKYIFNKGCA